MKPKNNINKLCREESKKFALIKSIERQKKLGEVFTPTNLVLQILQKLPKENWDEGKTFIDPSCGNGQFLAAVLIIKKQLGHKNPLETIFGVDIMIDNVEVCRNRLLQIAGDNEDNRKIVVKNIVWNNGIDFDYLFRMGVDMTREELQIIIDAMITAEEARNEYDRRTELEKNDEIAEELKKINDMIREQSFIEGKKKYLAKKMGGGGWSDCILYPIPKHFKEIKEILVEKNFKVEKSFGNSEKIEISWELK